LAADGKASLEATDKASLEAADKPHTCGGQRRMPLSYP